MRKTPALVPPSSLGGPHDNRVAGCFGAVLPVNTLSTPFDQGGSDVEDGP